MPPTSPQSLMGKTKANEWFTIGRFGALLAILYFVSFPDVVLGKNTFFIRDFAVFGYPLAHYHRESFWRGEVPLWNPLNECGLPFLAQWNTMVLYPASLFYLLLPLSWSLGMFCLLHQFLAGLGMYCLAYRWTRDRLAASVAGVAFSFNGFALNCLMWPHYSAALGWLPWVIIWAERAWREGGRCLVAASVVGAFQMLTGAPELTALTWFLAGLLWACQFVVGEIPRSLSLRRVSLLIVCVAGLSAAQLLPFLDLLGCSNRPVDYGGDKWSMPGTGWANLVVPLFYCGRTKAGIYLQPYQGFTSSYYPGIGVFLLSLFAALKVRNYRVWLLAGLCLTSLVLALGPAGHVHGWLMRILPRLGAVRYPVKFVMLASAVFSLLAAYGLRELCGPLNRLKTGNWPLLRILWLACVGLISFLLWFAYRYPANAEPWSTTGWNGFVRVLLLTLMLAVLYLLCRAEQPRRRNILALSFFVMLWLDIATHAPSQNPTVARSVYEPGLQALQNLKPKPVLGESRAMLTLEAWEKYGQVFLSDPFSSVLASRLGLSCNLNLLDEIPKTDGFFPLYLREVFEARSLLLGSNKYVAMHLADFYGVSQVNTIQSRSIGKSQGQTNVFGSFFEWKPRQTYMPLVSAGQMPVFVDRTNSLDALLDPAFDPRRHVFLPSEIRQRVSVTRQTDARIVPGNISSQRADFEVEASEPSVVVLAQAFYRPWKAYVDNQPTALFRANHAFQALQVPAGRHHLKLVYLDKDFLGGVIISGVTLISCLLGAIGGTEKKEKARGQSTCHFPAARLITVCRSEAFVSSRPRNPKPFSASTRQSAAGSCRGAGKGASILRDRRWPSRDCLRVPPIRPGA